MTTTPDNEPNGANNGATSDTDAQPHAAPVAIGERPTSPSGVPLPPDLRDGPVVVGVNDVSACGRPLRAAVFLASSLGRPVVVVHVRRRAVPLVEGYVPIPDEIHLDEAAEQALEEALSADLVASGEMTDVTWELISTSGDAAAELLRIAEERDAACLVVGKRHSGFSQFLHRIASGSVSHAVVSAQTFPTMVVP